MTDYERKPGDRRSTDESLRTERRQTDSHLAGTLGALGDDGDDVVAKARDKADSVLRDARDRQDEKLVADGQREDAADDLEQQRADEDAALASERSGADDEVTAARARRQLALASLLAHERNDTDLRLKLERTRADQVLSSREDFMAMVSHDLRTLLGGIALSAELVNERAAANAPIADVIDYANRIQRCCGQMNRLVGDLMDVASIEADKLSMIQELGDPVQLVRDSVDAFQPAARLHAIDLTCETAHRTGLIWFDQERILQVLTNLVSNALKFTQKGGRVTVRVESRAEEVWVTVSDTGEGIPADQLTQVFDRFFQAKKRDRRGLGLGLFIVKSIVQAHGGRVWAESTPGQGSRFVFTLPRRELRPSSALGELPP